MKISPLGVTLAAPVGPVSLEMIRQGLNNGGWSAFRVRLGGAIGNFLCLVFAFLGLSKLENHPKVMQLIGILGSLFLIYKGFSTVKAYFVKSKHSLAIPKSANSIVSGLILSLINPIALVFWMGVFAVNMQNKVFNITTFLHSTFIIVGVIAWGAFLSMVIHFAKTLVTAKNINLMSFIAGLAMFYYGVKYFFSSIAMG